MSFDTRALRDTLGCFATGVAIVTTRCADGRPEGLTVNSFASVSLEPPLVLFSFDRKGRCADCLVGATHFAIHFLGSQHAALSRAFSAKGGADWGGIDWTEGAGSSPVLSYDLATLQCETHARHDGGDHMIMVGRVVSLSHSERDPLLFFRGRYHNIAAPVPPELAA